MRSFGFLRFLLSLLLLGSASTCQPQPPEAAETIPGEILFYDDFSNMESGWNRVAAASGESDYADGMYRILVNETNLDIWAKPGLTLMDAVIEVDAIKVGGERDNHFGIVCRVLGANNFYTFMISSDGFYGIGKVNGADYSLIGTSAMQPSEAVFQGSAFNHLRATCIGDTLTMYVNNQKVAQVQDSEYTFGDVGLIAGSFEHPGVDIRFDNFSVRKP